MRLEDLTWVENRGFRDRYDQVCDLKCTPYLLYRREGDYLLVDYSGITGSGVVTACDAITAQCILLDILNRYPDAKPAPMYWEE